MAEYEVGDRVRVILEGEVTCASPTTFDIAYNHYVRPGRAGVVSVEVIEKAKKPLKVGDTVEGRDAYDALPHGVALEGYGSTWLRTPDGWRSSLGEHERELWSPRTIVYRPEQ